FTLRQNGFDCAANGGKEAQDSSRCDGFIHQLQKPGSAWTGWVKAMPETRNMGPPVAVKNFLLPLGRASDQTGMVRLRRLGIDSVGDGVIECDALLHSSAVNIA